MITRERIESGLVGSTLYHVSRINADGTAVRCRVNGKMKTWKRVSEVHPAGDFSLPVKHGLKFCFHVTPATAANWLVADPRCHASCAGLVNLPVDAPWFVVRDKLIEDGWPDVARYYVEYNTPCFHCGNSISFLYASEKKLRKNQRCFHCHHFMRLLDDHEPGIRVVTEYKKNRDRRSHYMIGGESGINKGHDGHRWTIKFLDGRVVTTTNLWHQGEIPKHLHQFFPVNATIKEG